MIIRVTLIRRDSEQWHIVDNAPMLSQLIWIQKVVLHFLDEEDLVEEQNVSLVAVGTIVCDSHISDRHVRQRRKIRMETGDRNIGAVDSHDMGMRSESAGISM